MKNKEFLEFVLQCDYYFFASGMFFKFHIKEVVGNTYIGIIRDSEDNILFDFDLYLSKRNIRFIRFEYHNINDLKFKPSELKEWSPALFLPCTNYLTFLRYLIISIKVYLDENHKLNKLLPF